jgi:hypothetical protein
MSYVLPKLIDFAKNTKTYKTLQDTFNKWTNSPLNDYADVIAEEASNLISN